MTYQALYEILSALPEELKALPAAMFVERSSALLAPVNFVVPAAVVIERHPVLHGKLDPSSLLMVSGAGSA